jgi:hypothetical protein
LRSLLIFSQFALFTHFFAVNLFFAVLRNFNAGFMQIWLMQFYVVSGQARKKIAIRVLSKAAPISSDQNLQMPVLPAMTLSGALLPRELRAATCFLA